MPSFHGLLCASSAQAAFPRLGRGMFEGLPCRGFCDQVHLASPGPAKVKQAYADCLRTCKMIMCSLPCQTGLKCASLSKLNWPEDLWEKRIGNLLLTYLLIFITQRQGSLTKFWLQIFLLKRVDTQASFRKIFKVLYHHRTKFSKKSETTVTTTVVYSLVLLHSHIYVLHGFSHNETMLLYHVYILLSIYLCCYLTFSTKIFKHKFNHSSPWAF